jgi:hypothetical protein
MFVIKVCWIKKELSYGFIIYGIRNPVAYKNNVAYWYGACLSHINSEHKQTPDKKHV